MPEERTNLSDRELALVQEVAALRGITVEEAADQLRREGLEQRFRKRTGRGPARERLLR